MSKERKERIEKVVESLAKKATKEGKRVKKAKKAKVVKEIMRAIRREDKKAIFELADGFSVDIYGTTKTKHVNEDGTEFYTYVRADK